MYDWEGLSQEQQITLENLRRHQACNQHHQREHARQGSNDDDDKDDTP